MTKNQSCIIKACIVILIIITLFPFFWVVRTSFTPHSLLFSEATELFPSEFTFANYLKVLGKISHEESLAIGGSGQSVNFFVNLVNSVIIVIVTTVFQTLFSVMAGYGFARLHFPGRDKFFALILASMMVPGIVMTIPNFVLVHQMGMLNTRLGIMLPTLIMTPYSVFFMKQFFLGINREIEEAAYIDGAGQYYTFFIIILPLVQTAIITLAVTISMNSWNDYMWPLIVGKKEELRTLTVALGVFRAQTPQGQIDWTGLMAGTVLAIVPALTIYAMLGKKIVNSIQFNGFR